MKRTLSLRREALTDLTPRELGGVAGGQYSAEGAVSCAATECLAMLTTDQVLTIVSRNISCGTCNTFLVTGC